MADNGEDDGDTSGDKSFDISELELDGAERPSINEDMRKTIERMERQMMPLQNLHKKLTPQLKAITAAQEAAEKTLGPFKNIQDRMDRLGLAAGKESVFGRLAGQIGAQQSAIDSMRQHEMEMSRVPKMPEIPPNPIFETNRRLDRIEKRFEQMQGIATDAAEIATGLQGAAAEFLQKFENAANNNDRAARSAIWIGVLAVFIAVAMPASQIIYSEVRREPNNGIEIHATLENVQAELAAMREAQAAASDRLNDALANSDGETADILREIYILLSRVEEVPKPRLEEMQQ